MLSNCSAQLVITVKLSLYALVSTTPVNPLSRVYTLAFMYCISSTSIVIANWKRETQHFCVHAMMVLLSSGHSFELKILCWSFRGKKPVRQECSHQAWPLCWWYHYLLGTLCGRWRLRVYYWSSCVHSGFTAVNFNLSTLPSCTFPLNSWTHELRCKLYDFCVL